MKTLSRLINELPPRSGYVYIIQDIDVTNFCKIGRTNNPTRRLYEFGVKLPFRIGLLHLLRCDDMVAFETSLHETFAHKRVRGEWFELTHIEFDFIDAMIDYCASYNRLADYTRWGKTAISDLVVKSMKGKIK